MAAKLKSETTTSISVRVDKTLKKTLKKKYGRKLSSEVVPFLQKLCG